MRPAVRLSLCLVGALVFWAWAIYGFIVGVILGHGPDGGTVGRFGALAAVIVNFFVAMAFTRWVVIAWKQHRAMHRSAPDEGNLR